MLSPIPVAIVEYCHSVKQAFLGLIQNLREERTPFYSAPSCLNIDAMALKNVILRANHLLRWLPIVYDRGRKLESSARARRKTSLFFDILSHQHEHNKQNGQ